TAIIFRRSKKQVGVVLHRGSQFVVRNPFGAENGFNKIPPFAPNSAEIRFLGRSRFRGSFESGPDHLIPNLFSLDCRVVRLRPSRAAAPRGPLIRPSESFSAFRMCRRSMETRLFLSLFSALARGCTNSEMGAANTVPLVRMTERSR